MLNKDIPVENRMIELLEEGVENPELAQIIQKEFPAKELINYCNIFGLANLSDELSDLFYKRLEIK